MTFDGKRDIFLSERSGADFKDIEIFDLQRALNHDCNYLFSLNKLAVIINFDQNHTSLKSNNLEYFMHPIAAKQVKPKTAAFDAARLLMAHQEFKLHKEDFMMKAALLLNKIQIKQKEKKAQEQLAKKEAAAKESVAVEDTKSDDAK